MSDCQQCGTYRKFSVHHNASREGPIHKSGDKTANADDRLNSPTNSVSFPLNSHFLLCPLPPGSRKQPNRDPGNNQATAKMPTDQFLSGFSRLPTYAEGQKVSERSSAGVLGPNGIRAWTHDASGVRIVLFAAPGPLVSATIVVGTQPVSNAGQPHTLEHIIFLGSHNHPERGYLDNLACRCLANGTNAWTANEYTAYTTKTAGFDGFAHLLPVFLDHVLRPRINSASFASEVYHIRGDGKEAGVVFCEMQARENTEVDISDRAFREALFSGTALALESGGLCNNIRTLSNDDVARFHYNQYCGANVTVIVGGDNIDHGALLQSVQPLLDDVASQAGYSCGRPQWQAPLALKPLPPVSRKVVPFPCPDEDIGTLILGWRGPGATDRETTTAIDVLLRYLAGEVWSPLRQEYVEIEEQLASEIDIDLETYLEVSGISISFSGVQHKEEDDDDMEGAENAENGQETDDGSAASSESMERESFLLSGNFEAQIINFLAKIANSSELQGGMRAMQAAIKKEAESQLTELESGSHDAVPYHLIEEVVYGRCESMVIGEETRGFLETFSALEQKSEQFWINLLNTYLVKAPRIELIMVPDARLAESLASDDNKAHAKRVQSIGRDALAKIGGENEARILSLKAPKFSPDVFPPLPSTLNISRWPYAVTRETSSNYASQSVTIDTEFVHCTVFLDTSSLPSELRAFLPILCEVIPTCDILLEDGSYIPYTDNARAISEATVSTDRSGLYLGFDNEMAHQCVVFHFAAMPGSFSEAAGVVLQTLFQSEVSAERLSAIAQTLSANATSDLRDGDAVLGAAVAVLPFLEAPTTWDGDIPNYVFANFLGSLPLISFISDEFTKKKPRKTLQRKVVRKMQDTLHALRSLPSSDIFIQVAARDPKPAHAILSSTWVHLRKLFAATVLNGGQRSVSELPVSRRIGGCFSNLFGTRSIGKVVGIAGVESCSFDVRVDSPVHQGHAHWSSMTVLTEMLSRMEGPLSNAVRGAGLAYDAHIANSSWFGHLVAMIYESSSPASAWDALCNCLQEFRVALDQNPEESGLVVDLETAKASTLFSLNRNRSTPESIAVGAISRTALGAPAGPFADQALEEAVEKVTLMSVREAFDSYIGRLCRPEGRLFVVTCGQNAVEDVIESFKKCSAPVFLEECKPEDVHSQTVDDLVKMLSKKL